MSVLQHTEKVATRPRLWRGIPVAIVPALGIVSDAAALGMASFASYVLYIRLFLEASSDLYSVASILGDIMALLIFSHLGLYRLKTMSSFFRQIYIVFFAFTGLLLFLAFVGFQLHIISQYSRGWALIWYLGSIIAVLLPRAMFSHLIQQWRAAGMLARRTVVVGTGEQSARLLDYLQSEARTECRVLGVFADTRNAHARTATVAGFAVTGELADLPAFVRDNDVHDVLVALPWTPVERIDRVVAKLKLLPVDVHLLPDVLLLSRRRLTTSQWGQLTIINIAKRPVKDWDALLKRSVDISVACFGLVLFAPLLAIVAAVIKLDSPGPVLFRQKRFGFNNRVFEVLKFRTMYIDRGDPSGAQRTRCNDDRVTRVGRILRSFSIDELPQLINVLKGDMSVVGPRAHPIAMKAGDKLFHEAVAEYVARHRVRPGITGWAQINGLRGEIDCLEKARRRVQYDLEYIENWSIWLDVRILVRTILVVLSKGAY